MAVGDEGQELVGIVQEEVGFGLVALITLFLQPN
jgi:hypothetical protein